jgi:3-deoxy-D-manno-octulosonic-acid transferase
MEKFWSFTYIWIIFPLLYFSVIILSRFNGKIKKGLKERNGLFKRIEEFRKTLDSDKKVILFHCVSMGELLQAKPLAKKIKENFSDVKIAVSFISPSGYDNLKESPEFDFKVYLPVDRFKYAEKFFSLLKPCLWIIVKHDIWANHIKACNRQNIPIILIDANLPKTSKRILPIAKSFFKSFYKMIDLILPVSNDNAERFSMVYPYKDKIITSGDTRYDDVYDKSVIASEKTIPYFSFYDDKKVFTAGSVWKEDLRCIIPALSRLVNENKELYVLIVPHEPDFEQLNYLERELFKYKLTYNKYTELNDFPTEKILIVDKIGLLASVYKYSYISYVGGSFTTGVHNVMEPAVFENPVLFGPIHNNSFEALEMLRRGGAFPIYNDKDIYECVSSFLKDSKKKKIAGKEASSIVFENRGATDRIMPYVENYVKSCMTQG